MEDLFSFLMSHLSSPDVLSKVAVFLLVQALVYLILSNSSSVFSPAKAGLTRSVTGLRTVRSVSIRKILAVLSDMPAGGESSASASGARLQSTLTRTWSRWMDGSMDS